MAQLSGKKVYNPLLHVFIYPSEPLGALVGGKATRALDSFVYLGHLRSSLCLLHAWHFLRPVCSSE